MNHKGVFQTTNAESTTSPGGSSEPYGETTDRKSRITRDTKEAA